MLRDVAAGRPEDRIFFALTGGASALLVAPAEGLTLADKIRTTDLLLRSGATIREMNAVRKHLSAVKGGRLLQQMAPTFVLVFVVSDVIGDDLSPIGSGPLTADPTSFDDCLEIVHRYGLEAKLPASVLARLQSGSRGLVPETPKPGDPLFRSAHHVVLANNEASLRASLEAASAMGYDASLFGKDLEGDVHEVAIAFAERLKALRAAGGPPRALLAGGELTLEVRGQGRGGRNQEFALVAARELAGVPGVVLLSAGTDGTDGPTDAAGAYADGDTWENARAGGLDPEQILTENDSYRLFDRLGDLLRTGPTGTNVNDLVVGLAQAE
jgi:glycerate 2-kinase